MCLERLDSVSPPHGGRRGPCVTSRGGAVRVLGAGFTVFKAHEVIA